LPLATRPSPSYLPCLKVNFGLHNDQAEEKTEAEGILYYSQPQTTRWIADQFTRLTSMSRLSVKTEIRDFNVRHSLKPSSSTSVSTTISFTGLCCPEHHSYIHTHKTVTCADNIYHRDQLRENALLKRYFCDVNINDLISFNEDLAHQLTSEPAEIIPLVRSKSQHTRHMSDQY
jgi:DNA replicative helicase MCM subunit Mcm2 (Cdc46/Mcm family)